MAGNETREQSTETEVFEVETGKQTKGLKIKKLVVFFTKLFFLIIGLILSWIIYTQFLTCKDCNDIVMIYFCILGLCCFMQFGLPIQKLLNKDIAENIPK